MVQTGLERFVASPSDWVAHERLGLLCNSASVGHRFRPAHRMIEDRLPGRLKALLSPQHGLFAEKQDNMIESEHGIDPILNIPIYSLYGETRVPTEAMFDEIDLLLVDLQDVGTRVYTFAATISYCLEAAKTYGKRVLILDRPNPINGRTTEGNCLSPDCLSFVGRYPIPMRHGLTVGELASLCNNAFGIDCDLDVLTMQGWQRDMYFADTGLPWIPPSPNLPTPTSAIVYPGQVIWEGSNISEGRGTTLPFEIFGAPFIEIDRVLEAVGGEELPGAILRALAFEPTSNKWQGMLCRGFQIHPTDPKQYLPYRTSLQLLRIIRHLYPEQFQWKQPPYEYEYERLPIDLIIGDRSIRKRIESFEAMDAIVDSWQDPLNEFRRLSRTFYLYE